MSNSRRFLYYTEVSAKNGSFYTKYGTFAVINTITENADSNSDNTTVLGDIANDHYTETNPNLGSGPIKVLAAEEIC